MSDKVEVRVVVRLSEPKQPEVRVELPEPPPEPEEGGYGHGV